MERRIHRFASPDEAVKAALDALAEVAESAPADIRGIDHLLREEFDLDARLTVYGEVVLPVDRIGPDMRIEVVEDGERRFVQLDICVADEIPAEASDGVVTFVNELNGRAVASRFVHVGKSQTVYAFWELPLAGLTGKGLIFAMRHLVESAATASTSLADQLPDLRRPLSRWHENDPDAAMRAGKALVELKSTGDG
jgi:hypothetical protein